MTYDFFLGQLRLALVGILAYASGRGWLTPADQGAIIAVLTPLGAIALPVLWSWSANWRKKYVPADSVAIARDDVLHVGGQPPAGLTVPINQGLAKVVGAILLAFLILAPDTTRAADLPLKIRNAQASTVSLTPAVVAANLAKLTQADLTFAASLATSAGTPQAKVRLQCYQAIIAIAIPDFSKVPNPHLISDFEYSAELIDGLQPTSPVMVQCAGAAQLFQLSALSFVNQFVTGALAVTALVPKIP